MSTCQMSPKQKSLVKCPLVICLLAVLVHFEDAAARREVAYTLPQRNTLRLVARLAAAARRSRVLV